MVQSLEWQVGLHNYLSRNLSLFHVLTDTEQYDYLFWYKKIYSTFINSILNLIRLIVKKCVTGIGVLSNGELTIVGICLLVLNDAASPWIWVYRSIFPVTFGLALLFPLIQVVFLVLDTFLSLELYYLYLEGRTRLKNRWKTETDLLRNARLWL